MRARRMPHQVQALRIRAELAGVAGSPEGCARGIVHEARHFHFTVMAVVRQHGDIAQGGEGRADKAVVGLVAEAPAAAMPEDDQRPRRCKRSLRHIHIDAMLRIGAVREIGMAPMVAEGRGHIGRYEGEARAAGRSPRAQSRKQGPARHAIGSHR